MESTPEMPKAEQPTLAQGIGRPRKNMIPILSKSEAAEENTKVTVWASLGATINLGNYESQKIDIGITGIPIDASDEFIAERLAKANVTLHTVVESLAQEMGRRMREDYGR